MASNKFGKILFLSHSVKRLVGNLYLPFSVEIRFCPVGSAVIRPSIRAIANPRIAATRNSSGSGMKFSRILARRHCQNEERKSSGE